MASITAILRVCETQRDERERGEFAERNETEENSRMNGGKAMRSGMKLERERGRTERRVTLILLLTTSSSFYAHVVSICDGGRNECRKHLRNRGKQKMEIKTKQVREI